MKNAAMAVVLALLVGIPVAAQAVAGQAEPPKKEEPAKEEPKKEEPKKDEAKSDAAADAWKAYRTKGNTWTHKMTTKLAGMDDMVSYMKYEVTEVTADKAVVKTTMMDKDQKETFSQSTDIAFTKPAEQPADAPKVEAPKTTEEKIKVEAGEFNCLKVETEMAGTKTTTWVHKEFSGVVVKSTSKSEQMESTMELTKFECK